MSKNELLNYLCMKFPIAMTDCFTYDVVQNVISFIGKKDRLTEDECKVLSSIIPGMSSIA